MCVVCVVCVRVCKVGVCCCYYCMREGYLKQKSSPVHTSLWMRANPIFKLSAMEVTLREEQTAGTSHTLAVIDKRLSGRDNYLYHLIEKSDQVRKKSEFISSLMVHNSICCQTSWLHQHLATRQYSPSSQECSPVSTSEQLAPHKGCLPGCQRTPGWECAREYVTQCAQLHILY